MFILKAEILEIQRDAMSLGCILIDSGRGHQEIDPHQ